LSKVSTVPKPYAALIARGHTRDIGVELLESVRQMCDFQAARVTLGIQSQNSPAMSAHILPDPKLDSIFKRLFSETPHLLADLINSVRTDEPPIGALEILHPPITSGAIVAQSASGQIFSVEMHAHPQEDMSKQTVVYLSYLIDQYEKPGISITFLDFDLFPEPDKAFWNFGLRNRHHPEITLGGLESRIVEMPKAERLNSQTPPVLADWVTWFRHWREDATMQQVQHLSVQKAHQRLNALSGDEKGRSV